MPTNIEVSFTVLASKYNRGENATSVCIHNSKFV